MALDPKKWTVKTQEAFAAAIDQARSNHNPELTPDHLLVALADQDGTIVAPVLAKLGQSPGMVRDRALAAVEKLPSAIGGDEPRSVPRAEQRHRAGRAVPQGPQGRLRLRRAPAAGDERPARGRQRGAVGRAPRRPRQPPRHRPEPGGEVRRPREVRAGPHPARRRGQDRPGDRPRRRDPACHPGALAAHQEQPGPDRRTGRRQDGDRRRPGAADRRRRRARGLEGQAPDRARHRLDARRCQVPRRVRGAFEGGAQGDHRRRRRGDHVRRRAAHDRRRRWCRGSDGRRQHDQADARSRRAAHDRRDHPRRVPQVRREGCCSRAPLPAGVRGRAVGRGHDRHPARPQGALRGAPRCADPGFGARQRRRAVQPLPHQPVPARQGDRPRRRGGIQVADRDRFDADRDRHRRAPDPAARDRTGGAREGERRRVRGASRRPPRRARPAQRRAGDDEGALGGREAGDRRHPQPQGGARAPAHAARARDRSQRRRRGPLRPDPRARAAHRRGHGSPRPVAGRAPDAQGGGRRRGHRRGRVEVDRCADDPTDGIGDGQADPPRGLAPSSA